jgi:hypothetical protein|tara:strand:+ start:51 stop:233 length:183 start_codon:yes stop_codon:yes gene_type:complete
MSITVSITNSQLEGRMNKAINKLNKQLPTKQKTNKNKFVEASIDNYIDDLLKQKIINSLN